jgi:type I restriction enzyme S subunit
MSERRIKAIVECCDILDNFRVPMNDEVRQTMQGNIPYYGANGVQGFIDKFIFDEGLILIAEDGGNFEEYNTRPIAYKISGKSWVNNHAHILRAKENFNQDYIFYSLVHKDILKFIKGGTRSKLNKGELEKIEIEFPATKKEEDKVAEIIFIAESVIEKTQAAIAKYKAIKQGMLQDLFTGGIDITTGKLRPRYEDAPELYKESSLGFIPGEWKIKQIGNVSSIVTNGFVGIATPYYTNSDNGIPYLFGTNIREDFIDFRNMRYISKEFHSSHVKSQLKPGDMLCVQSGHIGTCAVVPENFIEANCHALIITRFFKEIIYSEFISFYLNSEVGKHELDKIIIGSTIKHINTSELAKHIIPIPKIEEQKEIVKRLGVINKQLTTEQTYLQKIQSIKQGLMNDLLSGRKKVNVEEEVKKD